MSKQVNTAPCLICGQQTDRLAQRTDSAERTPCTLEDLQGISGMGAKKLEAYEAEVLRVCGQ